MLHIPLVKSSEKLYSINSDKKPITFTPEADPATLPHPFKTEAKGFYYRK